MALGQFNLDGQVAIVTGAGKGVGATVVGTACTKSNIVATTDGIEMLAPRGLHSPPTSAARAAHGSLMW